MKDKENEKDDIKEVFEEKFFEPFKIHNEKCKDLLKKCKKNG